MMRPQGQRQSSTFLQNNCQAFYYVCTCLQRQLNSPHDLISLFLLPNGLLFHQELSGGGGGLCYSIVGQMCPMQRRICWRWALMCLPTDLVWLNICIFQNYSLQGGRGGGSVVNAPQCDTYLPQRARNCASFLYKLKILRNYPITGWVLGS